MKTYDKLKIYGDGGSRGNPGPAASGIVVMTENEEILTEKGRYLGEATNNFAEYNAVILGLEQLEKFPADQVDFYLDSQLVVRQLNGQYKVKHDGLKPLHSQIRRAVADKNISFHHIPREQNTKADAQVNICLDAHK